MNTQSSVHLFSRLSRPGFIVAYGLLVLLIIACGGIGALTMPQPTTKTVARADLEGTYEAKMGHGAVIIELSSNGYFTVTGTSNDSGYGTWDVNPKAYLVLTYRSKPDVVSLWYVTDELSDHFDIILAGAGEQWERWRRIR
jgi:hypothetical protein